MDRYFVIRSEKHNGWFCGKCGKRLLPDHYNAQKHAQACGFVYGGEGASRNLVEDVTAGYRLSAGQGALHLEICRPQLSLIRGFRDRFDGIRWIRILEAVLPADSQTPVITENQSGVDLDTWLALIRAGRCPRIQAEPDVHVIRDVFAGIIGIYSLQMFVHLYRMKGFRHVRPFPERVAKRAMMTDSAPYARTITTERPHGEGPPVPDIPLKASLLRFRESGLVLRITLFQSTGPVSFLFTRGFAACSRNVDIASILQHRCFLVGNSEKALRRFARLYPEYYLEQYMELSPNVLVPLIGPDYHCLLELASRAAVPAVAENIKKLPQFEMDPSVCRNLREAFGLPVRVLRSLDSSEINDDLLQSLADIYSIAPGLLQFDHISSSMCHFYQSLLIRTARRRKGMAAAAGEPLRQYRIRGLERTDFTEARIHQILRYLYRKSESWEYLRDYLLACEHLEEYPYGFLPKIPVREAHNRVMARIRLRTEAGDLDEMRFFQAVQSKCYTSLTTNETEEDEETFRDDPYFILAPVRREDMYLEGQSMHNCVSLYARQVMNKTAKIYFLRKKEEPGKSLGTIEVRGSRLVQAKGFANRRLGKDAQHFVRKWCQVKHLTIQTLDIS